MASREVEKAKDRNGRVIHRGSKVKLIGKPSEAKSVYFTTSMKREINDGKIYTIARIHKISEQYQEYSVALEESEWNWDVRHVSIAGTGVKIEPPKPVMFEPTLLDI